MTLWSKGVLVLLTIGSVPVGFNCQFLECQDDITLHPPDGPVEDDIMYSWLGVLQYIHVKNGTPHYFRVPRVSLITRQFVLSTAVDAAEIPEGYALGNVVFGNYERDAEECHLSLQEIGAGAECTSAVLLMPISDVLLHPEYKNFGAKNSLALLKLLKQIKSDYVVPVCLPFKDMIMDKNKKMTFTKLIYVDYVNDVPRDFVDETKEIKRLSMLPKELCFLYGEQALTNSSKFVKNRMACTTGCDLHSGSPSLIHEHTGHWTIVAISLGGSPCPDLMRPRRPPSPPQHILIYPYVPWITAAIAGKALGGFAKDDPFGFAMARSVNIHDILWHAWIGHWYMGGPRCYDRGELALDMFLCYHEIFQVKPAANTWVSYYIEIDASPGTSIVCVKAGLPFRLGKPRVRDLNTPIVKLYIRELHIQNVYRFKVEVFAYNASQSSSSSSSTSSECSDTEYCSMD